MKLKSLLLGSAAALVAFSGARAADAVIAEPEPVEYVRVCDAYGSGYFYLPGTETCLKIGGFVRYDIDFQSTADVFGKTTLASIQLTAKSDTEMGVLEAFIDLRTKYATGYTKGNGDSAAALDSAYISLGGLKMGKFANAFDGGIVGEGDSLGGNTGNSIAYTFASGGFDATVSLDHANGTVLPVAVIDNTLSSVETDYIPNVSANAGFSAGAFAVRAFGAYDQETEEGALKLRIGADVTEGGRLEAAAAYATGFNYSWDDAEWTVALGYSQKVTDTVKIVANGQYWSDTDLGKTTATPDKWTVGAMVDWTPVTNFLVRAQVYYTDDAGKDSTSGKIRFERSF
jgi:hypothetical protein